MLNIVVRGDSEPIPVKYDNDCKPFELLSFAKPNLLKIAIIAKLTLSISMVHHTCMLTSRRSVSSDVERHRRVVENNVYFGSMNFSEFNDASMNSSA